MKNFLCGLFITLFLISKGFAANSGLSNDNNFDQYLGALVSYTTMSRVCDLKKRSKKMRIELTNALNLGYKKGLLTNSGLYYYNNLDNLLYKLEDQVKGQSYVTCGETKKYVDELLKNSKKIYKQFR